MIPTAGLYLIMHSLVILFKKILNFSFRNILSLAVIVIVVALVSVSVVSVIGAATNDRSNIHFYKSLFANCKNTKQEYKTKKIIIRIDDIQAFWLNDLQIKMLDELKSREMRALLGVIPINLKDDQKIYNYLKTNDCHFEVALHGWNQGIESGYTIPEFGTITEEKAITKIIKGKNILKNVTNNLITFIPPNNNCSEGAKKALQKEGFKVISAEGDNYFDYSVSTYNFSNNTLTPLNDILLDCVTKLQERNLCMIMIHPQDYISQGKIDTIKYELFLDTLTILENLDAMFVTPLDLINENEAI